MENKLTPDTKLADANFSVRSLNILKSSNEYWYDKDMPHIETLKDVSGFSQEEIYAMENCGIDSFTEIKNIIESVGLKFSKESNRIRWSIYGRNKFKKYKAFIAKESKTNCG